MVYKVMERASVVLGEGVKGQYFSNCVMVVLDGSFIYASQCSINICLSRNNAR